MGILERFRLDGRLADTAERELGPLSVWVNHAGGNLDRQMHGLAETTEQNWDTLIDLNLKTVWCGAKAAARKFTDGGAVINITSLAGLSPSPASARMARHARASCR